MSNDAENPDFKMTPPAPRRQPTAEQPVSIHTDRNPAVSVAPQEDERIADEEGSDFKRRPLFYQAIVENQRDADYWPHRDEVTWLREWGHRLIKQLDLRVKDAVFVGMPLTKMERMNVKTMGTYQAAADGFAIHGIIILNQDRLRSLEPYMKLVLLLKLLLCARQHQKGGKGVFDRDCRDEMRALGLVVTQRGAITIGGDGPFRRLLERRKIHVPVASAFPKPERKGQTTNQLWSCTCQRCRVGKKAFYVVCSKCNEPFRLGDHVGKRFLDSGGSTEPIRV